MPYYDAYLIPISPAKLDAYREVRDALLAQIRKRFGGAGGGNE